MMKRFRVLLLAALVTLLALRTTSRDGLAQAQAQSGIDQSFGQGGRAVAPFTAPARAYAISRLSNGKSLAVGEVANSADGGDIAIARFMPDGSMDPTFGPSGNGTIVDNLGGADAAYSFDFDGDGRLVIAGVRTNDFVLVRYSNDGVRDRSFGQDGVSALPITGDDPVKYDVVVLEDQRILVAGNLPFTLAMFESNGSLDTSFGEGGTVAARALPSPASGMQLLFADNGSYQVSIAYGGTREVTQFLPDGAVDTGFGEGGRDVAELSAALDTVNAMHLRRIEGVSVRTLTGIRNGRAAIARFLPFDLDTGFGVGGVFELPAAATIQPFAVYLGSDGRTLVAGASGDRFAVVRVNSPLSGTAVTITSGNNTVRLPVSVADTDALRACGLAGRASLPAGEGLLLVMEEEEDPAEFADLDYRFPVDIAFVATDGSIIGISSTSGTPAGSTPQPLSVRRSSGPTRYFLETNRGWFSGNGVRVGDRVDVSAAVARGSGGAAATCEQSGTRRIRYSDDFSDGTRPALTPAAALSGARYSYEGGVYRMRITDPANESSWWEPMPFHFSDVTVAVDVRMPAPGRTGEVALACRAAVLTSGYRLVISPVDGTFLLVRRDQSSFARLAEGTSPAVRTGNAVNRLELRCTGSTITALVNGQQVASVNDANYTRGQNWIGVSSDKELLEANFDNLVVEGTINR